MGGLLDSPWKVGVWITTTALIGIPLGYWKNSWWRGWLAVLLLGPVGILIMLLIPVSEETRIRRAQTKIRVQAEAAKRSGYPVQYPTQQNQASPFPPSPYEG